MAIPGISYGFTRSKMVSVVFLSWQLSPARPLWSLRIVERIRTTLLKEQKCSKMQYPKNVNANSHPPVGAVLTMITPMLFACMKTQGCFKTYLYSTICYIVTILRM